VGEHWPQPLLQSCARQRADNSVDLFPAPDHDEQRDRLRAKPGCESSVRVDVDLDDLEVPRVTFGEVFKHGRDHPTWPAPRRPEIHHHWNGRGRLGRERVGVRVDDPGQRGLASRASRDSLGYRADAIARVTGRTGNDRHDHQSRTGRCRSRLAPPDQSLHGACVRIPAATRRTCVKGSIETTRTSCSTRSTPRARRRLRPPTTSASSATSTLPAPAPARARKTPVLLSKRVIQRASSLAGRSARSSAC
jgi:hypothetical protein